MESVRERQSGTGILKWLLHIGHKVAFADYERVEYLQEVIVRKLGDISMNSINVAVFKRNEAVTLWYRIIPLYFAFVPLWLLWAVPLFQGHLSSHQIVAIIATILLSGGCYLLTFYNDSTRFCANLVSVQQKLLSELQHDVPKGSTTTMIPPKHEVTTSIPKGSVRLLLLNELVKKEAGYNNLFEAPVEEVIPFYQKLIGFSEKNFKKIMQQYRRRQDIALDQENARTTHIRYLDHIIQYYSATGEAVLERQAVSLQTFLNTTLLQSERKIK